MSRINPKYQGRRLFRILARHAGYWGVVERGATSVVATEADIGPHKDDKVSLPRYERVSISWVSHFQSYRKKQ